MDNSLDSIRTFSDTVRSDDFEGAQKKPAYNESHGGLDTTDALDRSLLDYYAVIRGIAWGNQLDRRGSHDIYGWPV